MSEGNTSLRWARACYGVDLQAEKPVIVRAERRRGGLVFSAVSPGDPSVTEAIRKGTPCVGCLTVRESLTRWLEAPFASRRKADKVLPTLLDIQLPFALEECSYDFLPAKGGLNVTRSLAVAARQEDVRKKVETMGALGLDPMALDQEGLALWTQSLHEAPPGPGEEDVRRLIVSLRGAQGTLVLGRGSEFLSAHGIRTGDVGQIRRLLKSPPASPRAAGTLADAESGMPMLEGKSPARWFWVGAGAADARLVAGLHGPLSQECPGPSFVHSEPESFLARALATRALQPGPLRCNLRSGALTHPAVLRRARRQLTKAAALFLVAGLVLCGCNLAARMAAREREARVDLAFNALADALAGSPVKAKGDAAIRIIGDRVRKKTAAMQPFVHVFDPSLTATLASVADTAKRTSLRLEMLSVSRDSVRVTGAARRWNGCDELLSCLKKAGYSAKLDRKDAGADGIVPFSISAGGADEP